MNKTQGFITRTESILYLFFYVCVLIVKQCLQKQIYIYIYLRVWLSKVGHGDYSEKARPQTGFGGTLKKLL